MKSKDNLRRSTGGGESFVNRSPLGYFFDPSHIDSNRDEFTLNSNSSHILPEG
ncbi:hypothetical protein [Argonema antarcticum]|uniref:hypothetical protein n=1 Tax=Argonema antarcticum TaxID=2942763 RepID=UPI0020136D25|nr:hypothetical protein [Argonema antarcticum]MCL1470872.1 hypothetical protein [Argonema antarcticum A004/B2]